MKPIAYVVLLVLLTALLGQPGWATGGSATLPPVDQLFENANFHTYAWPCAEDDPKAVVVLIHGFAMHATCYDRLAQYLSRRGYFVIASDMRGYGERRRKKSNYSKRANVDYRGSQAELRLVLKMVRQKYPNEQIFLIGESLGASMAIRLAANNHDVAGLILSSPAVRLKKSVEFVNLPCALAHSKMPFGSVNLTKCITKLVADEPQVREEAKDDELIRRHFYFKEIWRTLRFMHATVNYCNAVPATVPALVIDPSNDTLLDEAGALTLFQKLGSTDKTLRVFNDSRHILLETRFVRPDVLESLGNWLDAHSAGTIQLTASSSL